MLRLVKLVAVSSRALPCRCHVLRRPDTFLLSPSQPNLLSLNTTFARGYASKKKGKKETSEDVEEEEESHTPRAKSGKKGKGRGKEVEPQGSGSEGAEAFDLAKLETGMEDAVERLRVALKTVVGRVGRVSADLLDGIRVESEGKRRPLSEFATVTVKDGKNLVVTVYEESFMKSVSEALYSSSLSLTPQIASSTSLRVPIPRPDWDKRQQLVRQASELCENTRVSIRSVRAVGQKEIKSDIDRKLATKDDGRSDSKKLDASTKKRIDEVDAVFEKARKLLMDE